MTCGLVPGYAPRPLRVKDARLPDDQSAVLRPALFTRPIPVLALSGGSRRDCARSRMQRPSRNDTHLRIARLVAATHPVS
jgi:hypothetical protein